MSKTNCLYHIIICTKHRKNTIPEQYKKRLYAYIYSIIKAKHCSLIRLNGIENHLHLLIELHPTVALSNLVQDIKRSSSIWLSKTPEFSEFEGWGHEYFAFSKSFSEKDKIYNYICNQEVHHKGVTFDEEIELFSRMENFDWKSSYFG